MTPRKKEPASDLPRRLDRVPPNSEEAERGVLGSILLDAYRVMDLCVEHQVRVETFYVPAHRLIYETMLEMSSEGRPLDSLTVTERLEKAEKLDQIGGPSLLDRLIDSTPTAAHAEYYIDIIRQRHLLRMIIDTARESELECYESEINAHELLGRVEQSFLDIAESKSGDLKNWAETVRETMQQIETVLTTSRGLTGISTGYTTLDAILMGLHPGNIIILAARPSMGKTSLAMNIAEHVALGDRSPNKEAHAVGVFSLEMAASELAMRMICSHAGISAFKISSGYISHQSDHAKLVMAADKLTKAPIYLDDTAGLDIQELRARARRMKKMFDIQFIVVDYLQLLRSDKTAHIGREREISDVSGQLKAMAKELNLPVLVLSQLSRAPEIRDKTGRPKLSDLRDSGSIEQDADVVMLLRRPSKYPDDEESEDNTLAIVDIAKHRNGPVNDNLRLNFIEETMRFGDRAARGVDHDEAPAFGEEEAAMG